MSPEFRNIGKLVLVTASILSSEPKPAESAALVDDLILGGSIIAGGAAGGALAKPSPEMPDISACAGMENCEIHYDYIGNETPAGARWLKDKMFAIWCKPEQNYRTWASRQTTFRSYVTILCATK